MRAVAPTALDAAAALYSGDWAEAINLAEAVLVRQPSAEIFGILAEARKGEGQVDLAVQIYRAGLARFPGHGALGVNLARLLRDDPAEAGNAVALLRQVIRSAPHWAPPRLCLIETLRVSLRQLDQAESAGRDYIGRFPEDPSGYLALALTLFDAGRLNDALAAAERCTVIQPGHARAAELIANIAVSLGDPVQAMAGYRAVLRDRPDPDLHSRLLMTMQYCDTVSEAEILAETQNWARLHLSEITPCTAWPQVDFTPDRPLKIGIVSRDFRLCSGPYLVWPFFQHWPDDWSVTLYSNVEDPDGWTERFRLIAPHWVDIAGLDDLSAAGRIAADGIDVLIDMNGHTLGGRPLLFARRPAPVQLAWLDYVGSTGLGTIDAVVGDHRHLPLGDQPYYVEPIRHLPDNLYRYAPPDVVPPVTPPPCLAKGYVTFGSFNSAYKLTAATIALWSEVLRALPDSRLLLNAHEFSHADTRLRFVGLFGAAGIDRARLDFRPGAPNPEGMLPSYADLDIALDPMPYSGGLTSLEGLYMGVPVVTLPGARFGSRHSAAHLGTIGLDDWIARDRRNYVDLALRKAADPQALAALRSGLRDRVRRSALTDGPGMARAFSHLVREIWHDACGRAGRLVQPAG